MRERDVPLPNPPRGDRPSDIWLCGNAEFGEACPGGPTPEGKCPGNGLCRPVAKQVENPKKACARATCLGGPCPIGPEPDGSCGMIQGPCSPPRTWHGRRRVARNFIIALGVGVLLMALGGPWRREFLAPGPLAEPHAQLLSGALHADRCAACHPAARGGLASWFGTASVESHANVSQTQLCLDCHHALIKPDRGRFAHNLSDDELKLIAASQTVQEDALTTVTWSSHLPRPLFANDSVECSACHREHQGKLEPLTTLNNSQCQTCHQQRFAGLSQGHPEFNGWPYGRGGQVAFNHTTHQSDHFNKAGRAFDCRQCHSVSIDGVISRVASYDQACASCHDQSLKMQSSFATDLIKLPLLDADSVTESGIELKAWPEDAVGVDVVSLPPLMQLLLGSNVRAREAIEVLAQLGPDVGSEPATPAQIDATVVLANEIRVLAAELGNDPTATFERRLPATLSNRLAAQLPLQLIRQAYAQWFIEPTQHQQSADLIPFDPNRMLADGGWYYDETAMAIRYRGAKHADATLRTLSELSRSPVLTASERELLRSLPAVESCLRCHPQVKEGDAASWLAQSQDSGRRTFTKFSHRPHMNIQGLADCTHCHQVKPPSQQTTDLVAVSDHPQPSLAGHDFIPLTRSACVSCHTPLAAGDACIKCHSYHVDPPRGFYPSSPGTPLNWSPSTAAASALNQSDSIER